MASRFSHHISHRIAATALLAAMALPVLAQQPPATPPASPAASAKAAEGRHERHHGDMAQRHAKRLTDLKTQLKLTPAQEQAWTTFTTAMQPGERPARLDHQDMDKLTTPERIDRMRAMRSQHAAEADRRGEATKAFYAALTPEQQKTFDAQAHRGHPMGGMRGGEGRHGHGDHHGGMRGGEGRPAPAPAK
ncbi:Spy/CpxP family protein refolding chaperone [Acidovorax sp. D2M1]|uniref:Spy/CpxP family protein refolding chaperone n=1 Tax=Acidovorax benzenivorans TaxID=2987520 RepID=A0ABT5RRS4_9BURK|nr:Spy/CpxP family protein refolding chaperone [Acidovorax benzenivorans]MDD2176065.1 Spy/CpxP family protein refolding chaperone [Acidovorax benzenivorans]